MKHQAGFTLIELVVVIVILGILAIAAAPKFLNMQGDARESALKGLEAAIKSTAEMVHAKAVIAVTKRPVPPRSLLPTARRSKRPMVIQTVRT